ncbi:MAG: hypothetical protein NT138_21970 [Planctomycetales bacterium]|nr:hypothetical protein [Planctomycetales bacterium]
MVHSSWFVAKRRQHIAAGGSPQTTPHHNTSREAATDHFEVEHNESITNAVAASRLNRIFRVFLRADARNYLLASLRD